jgi:quercetin dioxygenase-like cupin family protein
MTIQITVPTRVDENVLQDERWDDQTRGTIRFRTLISAPGTPTDGLVCGIAMMSAGDTFVLHSHAHAEVYYGLEGEGEVMINGQQHRLAPGVALFIPGGAMHGIPLATRHLKWFYTFAADSFADIQYRFPHEEEREELITTAGT